MNAEDQEAFYLARKVHGYWHTYAPAIRLRETLVQVAAVTGGTFEDQVEKLARRMETSGLSINEEARALLREETERRS